MDGLFDDLIPAANQQSKANPFADLIPPPPKEVAAPLPDEPAPAETYEDMKKEADEMFGDLVPKENKPGFFAALGKGAMAGAREVGETFKQTAQLAQGGVPEAAPPPPADDADLAAPISLKPGMPDFPKLAYHFAQGLTGGSPEMSAALLTGLATTAAGAPEAALFTGPAAAAGVYVMRQIAPNFATQLQEHPKDPDLAWKKAVEMTTIGGISTAVGFAAFGINPFEGEIKNLAFQAFGVQPGVALTTRATENLVEDKKPMTAGEEGSTYAEAVLGTLGPYAAMRPFHKGPKAKEPAGGDAPPGPDDNGGPPPPGPDGSGGAFASPVPEFIKGEPSKPGEKINRPPADDGEPPGGGGGGQSFKIDPKAYGMDLEGLPPEVATAATDAAHGTETAAAALRKAMDEHDPDLAASHPIPEFTHETENAAPSEPAQRGNEGGGEPEPAGTPPSAEPERGGVGQERAGRSEAVEPEPAGSAEPVTVGTLEPAKRNRFRLDVSKATDDVSTKVFFDGDHAAYDPLINHLTIGKDVDASDPTPVAKLVSRPDKAWRTTKVKAMLEDGSVATVKAGKAADVLGERIRAARAILECMAK